MKTLFLIRHAKADWPNRGQSDIDRPLTQKGKNDAEEMAKRLVAEGVVIDTFITSTAKRTLATCEAFATAYNKTFDDIVQMSSLYNAAPQAFYDVIRLLKDEINSVAIFAHNPGITEMASMQTTPMKIIDMPTCGVYALKINIDSWKDYESARKEALFFKYPEE
jgi:phosphohistidine phosphatase